MTTRLTCRRQVGTIAEAVTALALFVPILVVVIYATIQATNAYVIAENMTQGAQTAARALSEEYMLHPSIVTDSAAQQAVFYNIRIPKMISSNSQFSIPANGWQTAVEPKTVTVIVTYIPGAGSPPLPPYPNPNILNLGSTFRIAIPATFRLATGGSSQGGTTGNGNGNGKGGNGNGNGGGNGNGKN